MLEAGDFALQSGAVLEAGRIRFANDSSAASATLRFSIPDELRYDASDAGIQPPSKGRYYVYAKCDRDRDRDPLIKLGDHLCLPGYTGSAKGRLWEKFTPAVVERSGELTLLLRLGAGAVLEQALVFREPYPYYIHDRLPVNLRREVEASLGRFVRPSGLREVDSGAVLSLAREYHDIHCMAWDGKHVWCGFAVQPSLALRVNPADMSTLRVVIKDAGGLHSLVAANGSVWAIGSGPTVTRIDPETCEYKTFRFEQKTPGIWYCSAFDGERIWIGTYSRPAAVVAIDANTCTMVDRIEIPGTPARCLRSLAFDGHYLWAGLLTRPGKIVRIDPGNHQARVYPLAEGEDNINSVCWDGEHLWAGLETRPATIVRYNPRGNTHESLTLNAGEDFCRLLVPGGNHVYAALYSTPAMAVKLSRDLKRVGIWRLQPGEDHGRAAVHDGEHFWVGLQMNRFNPGQLWRVDDE